LDPFKAYLEMRLAAGCTSATQLHNELLAQDGDVTYTMVRAHIAPYAPFPPARPPVHRRFDK
jgi:hypothetical protein